MNYFDLYPDVELPSFSDKRNSHKDFVKLKNLFKRAKIREDIYGDVIAFSKYTILGDDRPDNVAEKIYGDENLDWVVLISNNIINVKDEWPMGQNDFSRYLNNKYTTDQLDEIHHYETNEIRNRKGTLLLEKGLHVDADFTYNFSESGTSSSINSVVPITFFQHEIEKNDAKRTINLLKKELLSVIINDMRDIMTYTDSSQFINRKLKRGDNIRISEPK